MRLSAKQQRILGRRTARLAVQTMAAQNRMGYATNALKLPVSHQPVQHAAARDRRATARNARKCRLWLRMALSRQNHCVLRTIATTRHRHNCNYTIACTNAGNGHDRRRRVKLSRAGVNIRKYAQPGSLTPHCPDTPKMPARCNSVSPITVQIRLSVTAGLNIV